MEIRGRIRRRDEAGGLCLEWPNLHWDRSWLASQSFDQAWVRRNRDPVLALSVRWVLLDADAFLECHGMDGRDRYTGASGLGMAGDGFGGGAAVLSVVHGLN